MVGVGGMEGDVFGNGMLLTSNIRLLGAFDAEHIFLDPNPNRQASLVERRRLFETPGATWANYDPGLISSGGGVFRRAAKDIPLSSEIRAWLGARNRSADGEELIRLLLAAPVDLLWMGGVGTYVKASSESDEVVGDRANDGARVDATQVRAKVVGEGANLAFTQRARIEYALRGGRINTDAVDNSGGVDLSDHEVNLKILLSPSARVNAVKVSDDERNRFLIEASDEVRDMVLDNNYRQSLSLSLDRKRCLDNIEPFLILADQLENAGLLDRDVAFFPSRREAMSRAGVGLTRPELAVLTAYAKLALKRALLEAPPWPDGEWTGDFVARYFPAKARARYADRLRDHLLGREIAVTEICNKVINQAGASFLVGIDDLDPMRAREVVSLYLAFDQILRGDRWRDAVRGLGRPDDGGSRLRALAATGRRLGVLVPLGVGTWPTTDAKSRRHPKMARRLGRISRLSRRKPGVHGIGLGGSGSLPSAVLGSLAGLSDFGGFGSRVARETWRRRKAVRRVSGAVGIA